MTDNSAVYAFNGAVEQFKRTMDEAGPSAATHFRFGPTETNPAGCPINEIYADSDPNYTLDQKKLYVIGVVGKQLAAAGVDLGRTVKVLQDAHERADKIFRSQAASFAALDSDHQKLKSDVKNLGSAFEVDFTEYAMARGFAVPDELLGLIVRFLDDEVGKIVK